MRGQCYTLWRREAAGGFVCTMYMYSTVVYVINTVLQASQFWGVFSQVSRHRDKILSPDSKMSLCWYSALPLDNWYPDLMEELLDQISRVQEGELGVKEFQVAVLSALLSIMRDQVNLQPQTFLWREKSIGWICNSHGAKSIRTLGGPTSNWWIDLTSNSLESWATYNAMGVLCRKVWTKPSVIWLKRSSGWSWARTRISSLTPQPRTRVRKVRAELDVSRPLTALVISLPLNPQCLTVNSPAVQDCSRLSIQFTGCCALFDGT